MKSYVLIEPEFFFKFKQLRPRVRNAFLSLRRGLEPSFGWVFLVFNFLIFDFCCWFFFYFLIFILLIDLFRSFFLSMLIFSLFASLAFFRDCIRISCNVGTESEDSRSISWVLLCKIIRFDAVQITYWIRPVRVEWRLHEMIWWRQRRAQWWKRRTKWERLEISWKCDCSDELLYL